jgi:hypothetical protein
MGMIAAKVKLPGDGLFKDARRILQCSGIVLGAMSGAMPFANGMAPLAAYDLLAEAAAKAFRVAIGDVSHPGGESDPISWSLMVHERASSAAIWSLRNASRGGSTSAPGYSGRPPRV